MWADFVGDIQKTKEHLYQMTRDVAIVGGEIFTLVGKDMVETIGEIDETDQQTTMDSYGYGEKYGHDVRSENVLGGTDQWIPTASTEQETAPEISATVGSSTISWNASDYALLYAVCVDGKVKYFTTDNSYTFAPDEAGMVSVRAANEIGGLGAMSNIVKLNHGIVTGLDSNVSSGHVLRTDYYSIDGIKLNKVQKGLTIQRQILKDGSTVVKSVLKK